jgi:hypothetical protein
VVCNLEKVAGFEDSVFIDASFKKITTCNGSARNQIRCLMVYPSEGIIEVIRAE